MDTFLTWLSPILAVCIGVMILAVFFKLLNAVSNRLTPPTVRVKGFLQKTDRVMVRLNAGEKLENVKFVGFTDPSSMKGLHYHLANMVVFESAAGERILVRADRIQSLREVKDDSGLHLSAAP